MIQICPRCRQVSTFEELEGGRLLCHKCRKKVWKETIIVSAQELVNKGME